MMPMMALAATQRLDVVGCRAGLLGDERGEGPGVAGDDLAFAGLQRRAGADDASGCGDDLPGVGGGEPRGPLDQEAAERGQHRLLGPAVADRGEEGGLVVLHAVEEQVLLRREVVEDRPLGDVRGGCHRRHGHRVEAVLGEQPHGLCLQRHPGTRRGNATLVPAALADLAARGLDITVSLVEAGPDQAYALLQRAGCDLAITFDHPTLPAPVGLVTVPLLDDHLFVILPTTHPLAGEAEIDLSRLATEPWIISERCRAQTLHACALAGFTPTIALATDDYQQAVPRLVAAGIGVSLTTACVSRATQHPDVTLVPVAGIAPRRIIAVLPANPRPTAAVSAVLDALQKAASHGTGGTSHETR